MTRDCGAEAELVEPAPEVFGAAAHHRGEDPEVVAADGEHLPVEVLTLQLDGRGVARDHRGVGVVDLVQAHQVDGEAVARRADRVGEIDLEVVGALGSSWSGGTRYSSARRNRRGTEMARSPRSYAPSTEALNSWSERASTSWSERPF